MTDPKKIVEEVFEAITKRDFEKLRTLTHSGYTYSGADGQRLEGPDAAIEIGEMYTSAFPDLHFDLKHIHVAGNIVVTEFVASGTHQGMLMGIAPTGKQVKVPVCTVAEVRDDKIYAEREYFDTAYLKQQLGIDEARPAALV